MLPFSIDLFQDIITLYRAYDFEGLIKFAKMKKLEVDHNIDYEEFKMYRKDKNLEKIYFLMLKSLTQSY
ncbi:MAG: hypothetical protein ACOCSL_00350, partial [Thermoplasmatota archaeon]